LSPKKKSENRRGKGKENPPSPPPPHKRHDLNKMKVFEYNETKLKKRVIKFLANV